MSGLSYCKNTPAAVSSETSLGLVRKSVEIFMPWLLDELAVMPQTQLELLNALIRKAAHFSEFMVLGIFSGMSVYHLFLKLDTFERRAVRQLRRGMDGLDDRYMCLYGLPGCILKRGFWMRVIP